jgi:acetolactate synthase-1/2/3 large subunit
MQTGAELFVDAVERAGIRHIFTLVGDHLNDVLLCAGRRGFHIVDMRHEAAVVHAADAWARANRRPSLALVTGGPGHTNSLTGIATAFLAGSPVIAVSGSSASTQAQRGAFQDIDQLGMVRPVVKWAATPPSAALIPYFVGRAWAEATAGRMGPVHLTIPVDLFSASVTKPVLYPGPPEVYRPCASASDIHRIAELLAASERPVIIAGGGVWWSGAETELRQLAEKTHTPVYTISLGRGCLPDDHELSFGYADPALNRAAARAYSESDLILILGKRIDFRLGLGRVLPEQAKIVQVDIQPTELGMNRAPDLAICADIRETLRGLLAAGDDRAHAKRPWLDRLREHRSDWLRWLAEAASDRNTPIHPAALFTELASSLPRDILYSWDGGDFAHWGRAILAAREPGGWVRLGPLATIGAALPNALALQMANPDRPVTLITGDGALGFYIAELDTAVRHNLPIVVIVGNDAGWGLERELQRPHETVGCELLPTRYDIVMEGFGGKGELIESLEKVRPAVQRAFASRRPYLLSVRIRGARSPFTRWKLGDG